MKALEHRIPPPLVALVVGVLMWLAMRAFGLAPTTSDYRRAVSVALALLGVVTAFTGALTFRRVGTTLNPHTIEKASTLVTSGIFGVTRNPMYLGLTIVLSAWAVWLGSPWLLVGPALCALFLQRFQIMPEEAMMREKFGAEFETYCGRVRRWL